MGSHEKKAVEENDHKEVELDAVEITLNVRQIIELAVFAGVPIVETDIDRDSLADEFVVMEVAEGVEITDEDDNTERYTHVAYSSDDSGEGVFPLGISIDSEEEEGEGGEEDEVTDGAEGTDEAEGAITGEDDTPSE